MAGKVSSPAPLATSREALAAIERILRHTLHGSITIIVQDARIVQLERIEKLRPADVAVWPQVSAVPEECWPVVRERVKGALQDLAYGQLVIVLKDGKISQFDRTEKQRLSSMEGLYGDGI